MACWGNHYWEGRIMTRDEFVRLVQHSLVSYRDGGVAQMAAQDALLAAFDTQAAEVKALMEIRTEEIDRLEARALAAESSLAEVGRLKIYGANAAANEWVPRVRVLEAEVEALRAERDEWRQSAVARKQAAEEWNAAWHERNKEALAAEHSLAEAVGTLREIAKSEEIDAVGAVARAEIARALLATLAAKGEP